MSEQHLHAVIAKYLNHALPTDAWHSALDSAQPSAAAGRKLKARGGRRGISDHWIIVPKFPWIFFEIKTAIGRLSQEQVSFGDMIRANGGLWFMVRSAEEVEEALRLIGIPLRASFVARPVRFAAPEKLKRRPRKAKLQPRFVIGKAVVARARKQGILV